MNDNKPRGSGAEGMHACDRSASASAAHDMDRLILCGTSQRDAITRRMNIAAVQEDISARAACGEQHTHV